MSSGNYSHYSGESHCKKHNEYYWNNRGCSECNKEETAHPAKVEVFSYAEFEEQMGTTLVIYDGNGKNVKQLPCLSKKELKEAKKLLTNGVLPK